MQITNNHETFHSTDTHTRVRAVRILIPMGRGLQLASLSVHESFFHGSQYSPMPIHINPAVTMPYQQAPAGYPRTVYPQISAAGTWDLLTSYPKKKQTFVKA
jgi:hypothetical protein